jgi:hypothetical protein
VAVADARWEAVATRVGLRLQFAEAESKQGKLAEAKASMRAGLEDSVKGKTASSMFSARALGVLLLDVGEFAGAEGAFSGAGEHRIGGQPARSCAAGARGS